MEVNPQHFILIRYLARIPKACIPTPPSLFVYPDPCTEKLVHRAGVTLGSRQQVGERPVPPGREHADRATHRRGGVHDDGCGDLRVAGERSSTGIEC